MDDRLGVGERPSEGSEESSVILSCGCDSIWTSYFDRCIPCRNRLSIEAQDMIDRDLGKAKWERDFETGARESRIWNDPIEEAMREHGNRTRTTHRGGSR